MAWIEYQVCPTSVIPTSPPLSLEDALPSSQRFRLPWPLIFSSLGEPSSSLRLPLLARFLAGGVVERLRGLGLSRRRLRGGESLGVRRRRGGLGLKRLRERGGGERSRDKDRERERGGGDGRLRRGGLSRRRGGGLRLSRLRGGGLRLTRLRGGGLRRRGGEPDTERRRRGGVRLSERSEGERGRRGGGERPGEDERKRVLGAGEPPREEGGVLLRVGERGLRRGLRDIRRGLREMMCDGHTKVSTSDVFFLPLEKPVIAACYCSPADTCIAFYTCFIDHCIASLRT